MPQKGKLPPELKAELVKSYLAGKRGSGEIKRTYQPRR